MEGTKTTSMELNLSSIHKIGFGGGCHWCTEAVFQFLKGVVKVEQGWIASKEKDNYFSEAVIVTYNATLISLEDLIEIHLYTHKSTSNHSMRMKYRSAIYYFFEEQKMKSLYKIDSLQSLFEEKIITKVLPFEMFKASREEIQNYYQKNPHKPFCEKYINPKLDLLLKKYTLFVDSKKIIHSKKSKNEKFKIENNE